MKKEAFLSRAVLSTNRGMDSVGNVHPNNEVAAEKVFRAILNSVKIQETREK
ncbi:MAG: hypothetical protein IPM39_25985 [Chloroflexi bacterium]|nr:hypothetical protein [Chloroflexota bacterium]